MPQGYQVNFGYPIAEIKVYIISSYNLFIYLDHDIIYIVILILIILH